MTYAIAQHVRKHGPLYWTGERIAQTGQAVVTLIPARAARWARELEAEAAAPDLIKDGYRVVELADGREGWGE